MARIAEVVQLAPDILRLTAKTERHGLVEAADHIDQKSVELQPSWGRISQFAVGCLLRQSGRPQMTSTAAICLSCQAEVPRQKSEHAERDILGMKDPERPANQVGVVRLPSVVKNAGINAQTKAIAMFLASFRGMDALFEAGCPDLVRLDHPLSVEAPGNDNPRVRYAAQEAVDVGTLGQQHQAAMGQMRKERNQSLRQQSHMVQSKAVEHLPHSAIVFRRGDKTLSIHDLHASFWEHPEDSLCLRVSLHLSPQEDRTGSERPGCIHPDLRPQLTCRH